MCVIPPGFTAMKPKGGDALHCIRSQRLLVILIAALMYCSSGVIFDPAVRPAIAADCIAVEAEWKEITSRLRQELAEFKKVEDTHVERIIRRPLVDLKSSATIAEQVSEGLRVKEDILSEKRKLCRKLLQREEQLFSALEECIGSREIRRTEKSRRKLLKDVVFTMAEVREVEGDSQYSQYPGPWWSQYGQYRPPGQYSYWPNQQQQQMQRRRWWWGR